MGNSISQKRIDEICFNANRHMKKHQNFNNYEICYRMIYQNTKNRLEYEKSVDAFNEDWSINIFDEDKKKLMDDASKPKNSAWWTFK